MDDKKSALLANTIDKSLSVTKESGGELPVGHKLANRYVIKDKLGEGGMGVVYLGLDTQLDQSVAIKLLKKGLSQDSKAIENLKQEAQVAMMLSHPSVMRLINFETEGEYSFLLMEYVEGRPLDEVIKGRPGGRLSDKEVAFIAHRLCEALEYAHQNNVIHRDIKPGNVMISPKGDQVKLMDFGIARALVPGTKERPVIAGTLAYIAPEIFEGEQPDPRVDIYALGVTMYELLSGTSPFYAKSIKEIINRHRNVTPPPLEGVDRKLSNIVFQCIEKRPNARYQNIPELSQRLAQYLDIDEHARVDRVKKMMEYEQARLKSELKRVKREQKRLDKSRQSKPSHTASRTIRTYGYDIKQPSRFSAILSETTRPLLASIGAGLMAAYFHTGVTNGALIEFDYPAAYAQAADIVSLVVLAAIPALIIFGVKFGIIGLIGGIITGYMGHSFGRAIQDWMYENDLWNYLDIAAYGSVAVPLALVAGIVAAAAHGWDRTIANIFTAIGASILFLLFLLLKPFEEMFTKTPDSQYYIYFVLIAVLVWVAPAMLVSKFDSNR